MADVGTLTIKINVQDHGAKSGLASVRDEVSKTAGVIRNALSFAGGILLAQGIEKGVGAIGGLISAASNLNETVNKVGVVFGDSARGIEDWAQTAATSFGVSRQQALETAATFGNLFQAMGLGQKPAADMSESLVQLAADLGSFNNIDPKQVLLDLQSGIVGEIEPLRKYGIEISDNALQQEAMAEGINKSTQEMTQAEKVQLRYNLIMKQTTAAQGDFARTSGGLANQTRILNANLDNLRATMGQKLLPAALAVTNAANRFFDRFDSKRAQGLSVVGAALSSLHVTLDQTFGKGVGDAIDATLRGIVAGIGAVGDAVVTLGTDLVHGDVSGFFSDLGNDIKNLAAGGINIGKIAVNVAEWAIGQIPDILQWLKAAIVGPSEIGSLSGGANMPSLTVKLESVAVDVLKWTKGEIADVHDAVQKFVDDAMKRPVKAVDWTLQLNAPKVGFSAGFDLGKTIHDHLPSTRTILDNWKLILAAPIVLPGAAVLALPGLILEKLGFVRVLNFAKWSLEFGAAATVGFAAGLIGPSATAWVAQKIQAILGLVTVPLPSWNLQLPTPNVSFGGAVGLFAGAFAAGEGLAGAILAKIGSIVPDVPLPSWKLSLPTPDVKNVNFDTVSGWVQEKIDGLVGVAADLVDWTLNIKFPGADHVKTDADLVSNIITVIRQNLNPLEIGGAGTGGDKGTPLTINATVSVDATQAKSDVSAIKTDLTDIDGKTYKPKVSVDTTDFDAIFGNATGGGQSAGGGVLTQLQVFDLATYTTKVSADADKFYDTMESVGQSLSGYTDTDWIVPIGGNASAYYDVAISVSQSLYGLTGSRWTVVIDALDLASGTIYAIRDAIDSLHDKTVTINTVATGAVPHQHGGFVHEPLSLVGERGPELVSLPYGSYVYTNAQTRSMLSRRGGGGGITVQINAPIYGVDQFQAAVARAITEADVVAARLHASSQGM